MKELKPENPPLSVVGGETPEVIILVCEHYIREARAAVADLGLEGVGCAAFPARCARPPVTWEELEAAAGHPAGDTRTVVMGGCCVNALECRDQAQGQNQDQNQNQAAFILSQKPQCFEMVAGKTFVESQLKQGAFLSTPGWLAGWRQWVRESGFRQETAREFFKESITGIVLLDTLVDAAAEQNLHAFARFVDRPAVSVPVGIDVFKVVLHRHILVEKQELNRQRAEASARQQRQEQADFAMALDLLSELPKATSEKEAYEKTLTVFNMLFAPKRIVYGEIEQGEAPRVWLLTGDSHGFDEKEEGRRMARVLQENPLILPGRGFTLRMASRENLTRAISVRDIAFPEFLERYLQIAQAIADVCGLAIDNARSYERLKENENRLRELATTDGLTGVANRAHFMAQAEQEVRRAERYKIPFALIILDLDHFKRINDTCGHPSGDAVLKALAVLCTAQLRELDLFGRIGGEEFAAGLIEADLEQGLEAAERIRKSLAEHSFEGEARGLQCTASLGVTAYAGPGDSLEQMLRRADNALYQAKARGRNQVAAL